MTNLPAKVLASLSTPDGVEARLGRLEFSEWAPERKTVKARADSQSYPSPAAAAKPDGSTTIHVGPQQPADVPTETGSGWTPTRASSPSSACAAH